MTTPPNWDMSPFFARFEDHDPFREALVSDVQQLLTEVEAAPPLTTEHLDAWVGLLLRLEDAARRGSHLGCYLSCMSAAHTTDEPIQQGYARFREQWSAYHKAQALTRVAFKGVTDEAFEQLAARPELEGCRWALSRTRQRADHTLSSDLEQLAADLGNTSLQAWGQLYDQVTGRMSFTLDGPDGAREVPLALKRSLMSGPDRATRAAVLTRSNAEFERRQETFGAAINAIAGHRLTMQRWRGIDHFLTETLFESAVSRATLDAMFTAIDAELEVPRAYLRRKAALLGVERLGFQDLTSPLPAGDGEVGEGVDWVEARGRIERAFSEAYPALGEFAKMAFQNNWLDAEPRPDRRPGGFCAGSRVLGESRIFITHNNTLGDVQTLAHELGHAFHNWVMRDMRPWASSYPMTLAESASTFAEGILTDALLSDERLDERARLEVLNTCMERAAAFLLNVPMRFRFEYAFYQERAQGQVSVARIKELMLDAQRHYYGDSLDDQQLDPFFWASKLHFFITSVSFYNYPYTFGYLFSQGVLAEYKRQGSDFLPRYEALLRSTGGGSAEEIAQQTLGVDLTQPEFWQASIGQARRELEQFNALADRVYGR